MDAIDLALEMFIEEYGKKKWNKRIFILTDGQSKCSFLKAKRISSMIKENDVKVNIIALKFYKELDLEEGEKAKDLNEDSDNENNGLSKNQSETKRTLNFISENNQDANFRVFTDLMASQIQSQMRKKRVNPVVKYRGPLRITPRLSLDVCVYTKTNTVNIPSLKKFSLATRFSDDTKQANITNEKVYYVHDDPEQTPVSQEYKMKAYYYGKSLVPVSKEDEEMFKNKEHKCLKAIGFTDSFRVPRHYFMSGVDIVIPNPGDDAEIRSFAALVEAMKSTNKVLICRYVYRENSDPKLVVLSPYIGHSGPVMYLNQLPTIEDIRDYQFDSLKECSSKQEEVMSGFIDSLNLDENEEDEEILKPSDTFNPMLQYFYQCLEHRALNGDSNLPELDEKIENILKPEQNKLLKNKFAPVLSKVFDIKQSKPMLI